MNVYSKLRYKETDTCSFCNDAFADIEHIFWHDIKYQS